MKSFVLIHAFVMLLTLSCSAQKKIAAKDAVKYTGQTTMICDKVYNTEVVSGSNTTLLYLGSEKGEYLTETDFKGRNVCVTGKVVDYKGKPAIYVTGSSQLKLDLN
jgi:DNA/RNA endonuclease YhcR with UshA esterase domain